MMNNLVALLVIFVLKIYKKINQTAVSKNLSQFRFCVARIMVVVIRLFNLVLLFCLLKFTVSISAHKTLQTMRKNNY